MGSSNGRAAALRRECVGSSPTPYHIIDAGSRQGAVSGDDWVISCVRVSIPGAREPLESPAYPVDAAAEG